jgi:hypothetical protein
MTQVSKAIEYLSKLDPNEEIALTGWWVRADVEHNNNIKLTDEQWETICWKHEDNIEVHIDEIVELVLSQEETNE